MKNSPHPASRALIAIVIGTTSGVPVLAEDSPGDRLTRIANKFAADFSQGRHEAAVEKFDATMRSAMPPAALGKMWKSLETQMGPFKEFGPSIFGQRRDHSFVQVETRFERQTINLKVVFKDTDEISGLWVEPVHQEEKVDGPGPGGYRPPKYDKPDAYTEEYVTFGEEPWLVRGVITVPKGEGRVPAVVLVHGSGPHDEDETIGPNKPFKDLACGLSSSGIAVLRYQKRTHAYQLRLAAKTRISVREEVVDDAVTALKFVRGHARVDPDRVYVVGHSLGGTLAPQIAREDGKVAGAVLLAGTARDLTDVLLDQLGYIASLPMPNQAQNQQLYDEALATILKVRNKELGEDARVLNVPMAYWNELAEAAARSLEIARELKCRMLIVNGGRDYQVTRKDYDLYKRELKDRENVSFKWFKDSNHLFFRGEGMGTPAEYGKSGHVDGRVVRALAKWITE